MFSQWLPLCQFHFRRLLRKQPVGVSALIVSLIVFSSTSIIYAQQIRGAEAVVKEWQILSKHSHDLNHAGNAIDQTKPELNAFNNTQLVDALNSVAEEMKLSLDEVSFILDDNVSQPYLRYHATLTVSSTYPTIRHFIDQVHAKQPDISLDSITCTRADISTVDLTCDLTLSAFYRKENRG